MATDMTGGKIMPKLIGFTVPLVLGNLFQLTYNAADSVIVGQFVGDGALAAVGTAGPVMNLAILFISGMCMGAGILMSMLYGAKEKTLLERQISTAMIGGLWFSVLLTLLMVLLSVPVLRLIRVPEDVIYEAAGYLRIIFLGFVFSFVYNFFANTLRALGDSKTPLYFLVISSVFNIIGDLFFVVVLKWGVNGSAVATVLSQFICCASCALYIKRKVPVLCLGKKWRIFDRGLLAKTFSYGITSALQMMCIQLGKVFVQAIVNTKGVAFMAAFAATNRVDDFILTPQQNIAHATTTFMAQNRGAGNLERMQKGFYAGVRMELVYTICASALVFLLAEPIMRLFVPAESKEVIELGVSYMRIISLCFLLPAATNILQGFFRGIGNLNITLVSTITNMASRVVVAFVMLKLMNMGFSALAWSNGFGWMMMLLIELPLYLKHAKRYRRGEAEQE